MKQRHPFRRLLDYASSHRSTASVATAYSVLNKIFDLAPPALIGAAVDVVVRREDSFLADLGVVDVQLQLWALLAATVLIWSFESLFEWLAAKRWRNLAQQMEHEVRVDASLTQHLADGLDEPERPAQVPLVHLVLGHEGRQELLDLGPVDPAVRPGGIDRKCAGGPSDRCRGRYL